MAVPTFTTDLIDISTAETTTGWAAVGGSMGAILSTDFFRQGSASIATEFKNAAGRRGVAFDAVTGIDFTVPNRYLYVWLFITSENTVNTIANDGVRIYVSSAATDTDFEEFTVGGSDAPWVGKGWKQFILDINNEVGENITGTLDRTSCRQFGLVVDMTTALGKADGFGIDMLRYGSKVEVTGGTSADPITFQSIADEDAAGGSDTQYGVLYDDATGSKLLNGGLIIGDEVDGGSPPVKNTYLASSNEVLIATQERLPASATYIAIDSDSGTTTCRIGQEVGTGDDSRGVGGGLVRKTAAATGFYIDATTARNFDEFSWWGGTLEGAVAGVDLQNTEVEFVGCSIAASGQIILDSGAEMREGFIIESVADGLGSPQVGAILINANPTTPEFRDMTLINNKYAIESETDGPTTLDLRNIKFAGNTGSPASPGSPQQGADIIFNHSSGLLTVNVLELGDTPTTFDGGFGGTILVVAAVSVIVTVLDIVGDPIETAQVAIFLDSDSSEITNQDTNASGVVSASFGGNPPVAVSVRVRKNSPGDTRYFPVNAPATITSSGLAVTITLIEDEIAV